MRLSFYKHKLKETDWAFEFCLLLPTINLMKRLDTPFQKEYQTNKFSFPTRIIIDSSGNKCYIEFRLLGFGFSYHFYKTEEST